ncbi:MAG TPA: thiolase family protein, partial [Proteobacteria bacterium]|nr:thiolase family protein [Pseudomonadota bacterium]
MAERIGICAVAQTSYERAKDHQRQHEMIWEVVKQVVPEAGLSFDDIGAIITVSDDVLDARTISDAAIGDVVGAHLRAEEKVAHDSAQAIYYVYATVVSGHADVVLVAAHAKESQPKSRNLVTTAAFDPIFERLFGMDYIVAAALQARAYMERFDVPPEAIAEAVVRSRKNAAKNPKALLKEPITVDEVIASPMLADPLHEPEVYPACDGACALVVAKEDVAGRLCDKPVWVTGVGNCYGAFYLGDRELWRTEALEVAARRAYEMAGVSDAATAFDLVEVSDGYAHQQLM